MADQENINNARRQNELYDVQVSTLEALNRLAQQRVVFEGETADEISNANDVLREQLNIANKQKDGTLKNLAQQKELNKVNNQTLGIARSIQSVTASELGSQKLIEKVQKDRLKVQKNIAFLQKAAQKTYSEDKKINQAIQDSILAQVDAAKNLVKELDSVKAISEAIANDGFLSIFNTLKDVVNLIPGLRNLLPGFDQAAESYREALILQNDMRDMGLKKDQQSLLDKNLEAYKKGTKQPGGLDNKFMGNLPKELQDQLKDKDGELLTGTAALARMKALGLSFTSPIKAAFKALGNFMKKFLLLQFVNAILKADKVAGDLAKSMNVTYGEALDVQQSFNQIANTSNSLFVTGAKIAETQMFFNKELGTSVMLTDEQLTTMTKLREAAGFTNEELAGIAKISITTGKEAEKITGEVLAQARISATRLGVVVNERDIVKEISKVSAATTLSLGKSEKAIADAVTTAKALGMELSKVEAIAGSILQFESSIEDELSAELLIGKELNLERARFAALNNDVKTLSEEIAANFGSSAEFGEMNRIQQEALAKAVGMNREELAQTLYVQEQLAGVSGEEAKRREKILNDRIAEVGLAQAQQEMAEEGYATLEQQASVQDRINATVEKLGEVFAMMSPAILTISNALMLVFEILNPIFWIVGKIGEGFQMLGEWIGQVIPNLGIVGTILKGLASFAIVKAAYNAFSAIAMSPAGLLGPGAIAMGTAAAAAITSAGFGLLSGISMADDLMSPPTGGSGYGDRILVSKEGNFALNNRDTIQASTVGPTAQSTQPIVETKLYIDNEAFAQAQSKSFSKL
jgi:hypothetical protein